MSEDVARAVGAEGTTAVLIAGKECTPRPLSIRELTQVQRKCVEMYKENYLKDFAAGVKFLDNSQELMIAEARTVARWDVSDLPTKSVYEPSLIDLTDKLREHVQHLFRADDDIVQNDMRCRRLVAGALDREMISPDDYKRLTGQRVRMMKVPYDAWWTTGTVEGMVEISYQAFKQSGVTREDIYNEMVENQTKMTEVSRQVENLSQPSLGNG